MKPVPDGPAGGGVAGHMAGHGRLVAADFTDPARRPPDADYRGPNLETRRNHRLVGIVWAGNVAGRNDLGCAEDVF